MARIIICEERMPLKIEFGGVEKWICLCGLSKNKPYCDGSHKKTLTEEEGKLYRYQKDGSRAAVANDSTVPELSDGAPELKKADTPENEEK